MGVEIFHDPPMHGRALFQPVCPGERVDLAEDEVVYPADLGRDDLRRLPGGRYRRAAGVDFVTHDGSSFELLDG